MNTSASTLLLTAFLLTTRLPAADVRLHQTAVVNGDTVKLADIATVSDVDPKVTNSLKAIVVARSPQPGGTERISYADVRSRMRVLGYDLARVRFAGRSNVLVTRRRRPAKGTFSPSSTSLSDSLQQRAEDRLNNAIEAYIARVAPALGKLDVRTSVATKDIANVLKARRSTFRFDGFKPPLHSRQTLTVKFADSAGKSHAIAIQCDIKSKPYVVAAKYDIPRGTLLRNDDLALVQVDGTKHGFQQPRLLVGTETKRPIRKGSVLKPTDIRRKPLIRRNQTVYVVARRSGIAITRRMRSRGEGALGDYITVYDPKSREEISVRVTGSVRAEVVTGGAAKSESKDNGIVFRRATRTKSRSATVDRMKRLRVQRYDRDLSPRSSADNR